MNYCELREYLIKVCGSVISKTCFILQNETFLWFHFTVQSWASLEFSGKLCHCNYLKKFWNMTVSECLSMVSCIWLFVTKWMSSILPYKFLQN